MKKYITIAAALCLGAFVSFGQEKMTMEQITEAFNNGVNANGLGQKDEAISYFQKALDGALALGDEGKEVVENCKTAIPQIYLSKAKEAVNAQNYDDALVKLDEAKVQAEKYGAADILSEIEQLVPQITEANAKNKLKSGDYAGAAEIFKGILEQNPTDGNAALYLGQALQKMGDNKGAEEAFLKAIENGTDSAKKSLSNMYVKEAASLLKAKNYEGALAKAKEAIKTLPSANAYKIAGTASNSLKKTQDAVTYFTEYLKLNPNDTQIKAAVEALKKNL